MVQQNFTTVKSTLWKEFKLLKSEWDSWYPFKVSWFDKPPSTLVEGKLGNRIWGGDGYFNIKLYTEEAAPITPPKEIAEETVKFWMGKNYNYEEAVTLSEWVKLNKQTPSTAKIREILRIGYKYKILPQPPGNFTVRAVELYQELDKAVNENNKVRGWEILREMSVTEMSPIIVLAALAAIAKVVTIIVGWLGSIAFAKFLMEETLQTLDFAIKNAADNKDWVGMGKALATKKEVLDETGWEHIISFIPGANIIKAAYQFVGASRVKYEIDLRAWKEKTLSSGVNTNVNLEKAAAAIERGEDPTQYLPKTESVSIPETISGEVTGVIDGDTIDVKDMLGYTFRVRLIGIDAPEFKTTQGKASAKFLTDQIHGKRVNVKVDLNNKKDEYDRVLGVVFKDGVDINKLLLQKGHAQYYFIGSSKYYSEEDYKTAAKRRGKVAITSKPTYSKIYLDRNDTLKLTAQTFEMPEGTYVFGCAKEGYVTKEQTVTIMPDETIEIRFELEKTSIEERVEEVKPGEEIKPVEEVKVKKIYVAKNKYGFSVDTTPDGATIIYNNRKRKYMANSTYITATQSGTVVARLDGYEDVVFNISLKEKDVKFYKVNLIEGTWEEVVV